MSKNAGHVTFYCSDLEAYQRFKAVAKSEGRSASSKITEFIQGQSCRVQDERDSGE